MPTLLELACVPLPAGHRLDGVSLRPLMLGQSSLESRTLFWQHGNTYAIRQANWKAVINSRQQLFNLETDLAETTNLADQYPDQLQSMLQSLETWKNDVAKD